MSLLYARVLEIGVATPSDQRVGVARLSRRAHNPETGGSNPPLATKIKRNECQRCESDECEMKVEKRYTAKHQRQKFSQKFFMQSIVASYTDAL